MTKYNYDENDCDCACDCEMTDNFWLSHVSHTHVTVSLSESVSRCHWLCTYLLHLDLNQHLQHHS